MPQEIVPIIVGGSKRFAIADETEKILDDAQGYGYKTAQNAQKALWYKFKGGKEHLRNKKAIARAFWRAHPDVKRTAINWFEISFKEFARGEATMQDLADELSKEFGLEIKVEYLDDLD